MFKTEEYEKIIFDKSSFDEKINKIRNLIKKGENIQAFKALTTYCISNLEQEKQEIINQEIRRLLKNQEIIDYILSNDPSFIFTLPEGEIFKEFVDEYYDVLKEYFKGRLVYQYSRITDDLNDEPFPAYYKKDFNYWDNQKEYPQLNQLNYIILPIRKDSYNCYYFYKKFRDSIDICITNDGYNSLFSSMEFPRLLELFKEEYKYKNYNSYLIFHEILCRSKINNYQYSGQIDIAIYKEIYKRYKEGYNIENIDFFTQQIMEKINISSKVSEEFDLINYMSNIKYLRTLPKQKRRKSKTYQELFKQYKQHFINECQNRFIKKSLINFTDEDNHILELVFSRSINQNNIFKTLKINSLEKIYFFFKTNSIEISDDISLDEIKRFNVKQYYSIKEKMNIPLDINNSLITEDIDQLKSDNFQYEKLSNEQIIELLCKYDYDFLNTLLTKKGIKSEILTLLKALDSEKLKNKDYQKIIYQIIKDLNEKNISLKNKVRESPVLILRIIDFMLERNYPKITLDKILKRINKVSYLLFPNNYQIGDNLANLDLVAKGEPFFEKIEAISLYDTYRNRVWSSIPELSGQIENLNYSLVDMHDVDIISNGIGEYIYPNQTFASSCLTPNGKAASCLKHGATNPHGRFLKITKNDKIIGYSWLWRQGELLCLDNLELTKDYLDIPNNEKIIYNILTNIANSFIEKTKNDKNPIKLVILGRNKIDVKNKYIDNLECVRDYQQDNFKPQNYQDLYLKDSEEKQVILAGEIDNINLNNIEPIYKYNRKPVISFDQINKKELEEKINSIYFDYCLKENIKYTHKKANYLNGYLGEDWFQGIKEDGTEEIYTCRNDQDIFDEMKNYTNKDYQFNISIFVPKTEEKEKLDYLRNLKNYIIDEEAIKEYFEYIMSLEPQKPISDYFHSPQEEKKLLSIFVDHAITSNYLGKRKNNGGSNGNHFICLAQIPSSLYDTYSQFPGFGFKDNLCTFRTDNGNNFFTSTSYPIRYSGNSEEYQVKDFLSLDRANALIVPCNNHKLVSILPIIQDYTDNNLPLYNNTNFQQLDKDIIKKHVKLK